MPRCSDCKRYWYDPGNGWRLVTKGGRPLPRRGPTPCDTCPKGPVPFVKELTPRSLSILRLYFELKAGRPMPPDPLVWRCAGLIRYVEDSLDRRQQADIAAMLAPVAALLRARLQ